MPDIITNPILFALLGTTATFLATALGAAMVFFMKRDVKPSVSNSFLGFAAGVMIAASIWSLLQPSIEMTAESGGIAWLPAAGGFVLGGLFLYILDRILPHLHPGSDVPEGPKSSLHRTTMLVLAVTLHNIPEGLAIGLAFGLAARNPGSVSISGAVALAIGMSLQNFPEGAAISLPLHREGFSRTKSFIWGALSGVVEPVAGVIGVIVAGGIISVMPWLLSFAAGAMIYVVVDELIPESQSGTHSNAGTIGAMLGFVIMMILDVALA